MYTNYRSYLLENSRGLNAQQNFLVDPDPELAGNEVEISMPSDDNNPPTMRFVNQLDSDVP